MDFTILRTLRKAKGLTLKDVAPKGITPAYLSLIERNKKMKQFEIIEDICNELDCELRIIPKT